MFCIQTLLFKSPIYASIQSTPTQNISIQDTSTLDTSVKDTPTRDISIKNNVKPEQVKQIKKIHVRVLLDQADKTSQTSWQISCPTGLALSLPNKPNFKKKIGPKLQVNINQGQIYLNHKKLKHNTLYISPAGYQKNLDLENLSPKNLVSKNLTLNNLDLDNKKRDNNQYDGIFIVTKFKNKILVINKVELEDYIYSVLKTESWPGWPKEVNKALAIAARSYVITKLLEARKLHLPYHIKNTNHHQTYFGTHNVISLKDAVQETKGILLGYNNKPILAMFDSCCGGIIPAHMDGVDFTKAPYLKRNYPCTHCKNFKIYSWKANYSNHEFKRALQQELPKLTQIKKLSIQTDKAGIVQKLIVHDKNSIYNITGNKFYRLFKEVKSFYFSISNQANQIFLSGLGYGHHLGMCQWGARQMVAEGWNFKRVLKFFYPNTKFMKLQKFKA